MRSVCWPEPPPDDLFCVCCCSRLKMANFSRKDGPAFLAVCRAKEHHKAAVQVRYAEACCTWAVLMESLVASRCRLHQPSRTCMASGHLRQNMHAPQIVLTTWSNTFPHAFTNEAKCDCDPGRN